MLKSHEIVSFPVYVWQSYSRFISEKELILLGHFQAVQESGKKAWEIVAKRMGYDSVGPITTMLNRMEKDGCITVYRGDIDATPLYERCFELYNDFSLEIEREPKEKKQPKREYQLAREVLDLFPKQNIHGLASTIKKVEGNNPVGLYRLTKDLINYMPNTNPNTIVLALDKISGQIPYDDFIPMVNWMDSFNEFLAKKFKKPKKQVGYFSITVDNWKRWVDEGRPTDYQPEKKKKEFTTI